MAHFSTDVVFIIHLQELDYEKQEEFVHLDPKDYGIEFEEDDTTYGEYMHEHTYSVLVLQL